MGIFLKNVWDAVLFSPILNIFYILYRVFQENLGLAVIALAVIVRLALIPLIRQQMDGAKKMKQLKPRLEKLQKKYANNQEKLAKEQVKMYKEIGYNPVGCLGGFFVQMIVLIVVVQVIRMVSRGTFDGLYPSVATFFHISTGDVAMNNSWIGLDLSKDYIGLVTENVKIPFNGVFFNIPYEIIKYVFAWVYDFKVFPYWILAVSVGIVQYFSSKFTMYIQGQTSLKRKNKKKKEDMNEEEMAAQMSKSMVSIMPLMSVLFTLKYPAVLGLYWFTQTVVNMFQYFIIDKERTLKYFHIKLKVSDKSVS